MKNEVQAIIIMNANFTTPWTFGGAKQELFSNMFLASTNDMDLQHESMEQVENGYHMKTKIEAMTPQYLKR